MGVLELKKKKKNLPRFFIGQYLKEKTDSNYGI